MSLVTALLAAAFIAIGVACGSAAALIGTSPRGERHEFFIFLALSTVGFFSAINMLGGTP